MSTAGALPMATALSIEGGGVWLDGRCVLQALDLALPQGAWWAVVGPNGAGKSTLLRAWADVLPSASLKPGLRIKRELAGRPWQTWPALDRARHLVWVGEDAAGDEWLVQDVVSLGRWPHQGGLQGRLDADQQQAVEAALMAMDLTPLRWRRVDSLSAGERQRLRLARGLATQALVMLMDEPLAHLDVPHQAAWVEGVRAMTRRATKPATVLSVLHDLNVALQADQVVVMQGGFMVHCGPAASAATRDAMQDVFGGRLRFAEFEDQWRVWLR